MFANSPISKKIFDFSKIKFGQTVAPICVLKACAIASNKLEYPRLNVWGVAPTRQYKTQSSKEIIRIFPEKSVIDLGSDFTIHGLHKEFGEDLDETTLNVNDGTILFASKSARAKDRLTGAFTELLSDEKYCYKDFKNQWTIKGKCTAIVNQTAESFNNYKNRLFGLTLSERFFTAHYRLTLSEQKQCMPQKLKNFHLMDSITIKPRQIKNLNKFTNTINKHSLDYSALSLRSYNGCRDVITALLKSHTILNGRNRITLDEIEFVKMMRPYLIDPFASNDHRIIEYLRQKRSYKDICLLLNKKPSYKAYISKVARKAKERGLIDF